jgi:RNA polymerase sigma-70 factor (ECF subfamily)
MQPDQNSFLEGEALRLAQQGNATAFEFLYRLHRDRVHALCLRMVKNPVQTEDLTQETFLGVLRGIREFRGQSAFTTWLHQVTRNTVLMSLRKKRLEKTSLEEITGPDSESRQPPVELGTRDRHLEATADRLILRLAVSKLSWGLRKALLLQDVHSYEHKEVAAILVGLPELRRPNCPKRVFVSAKFSTSLSKDIGVTAIARTWGPPAKLLAFRRDKAISCEPKPKPDDARRKCERAISSWCEPLDDKAASPRK